MRPLALVLMMCGVAAAEPPAAFPAADADAAWARLPREAPPLPPWARALVGPLPKTTAKMLELDHLQRAKNPLGAELAALIHWTAADALDSKYGRAAAEADLKRTTFGGVPDAAKLPADVRTAVAFARKLTTEGHAITDAEFAAVLRLYGPEKTTAIVHTVAFDNFLNRVLLGLGADGDPVPPVGVPFDAAGLAKVPVPVRPPWDDLTATKADGISVRADWKAADDLDAKLDKQKGRSPRIPLPSAARLDALPPREKDMAGRVLWNTVSSGYQPEMTRAWFACLSAFYEESKVDRVFTNSMFWVVTRTNDCFY